MEELAQKAIKNVDRAEKDISVLLALKEPVYPNLEPQLAKLRTACQDFIFVDFAAATISKVDNRLWDAHANVNRKFRPLLAQFREGDGKKKHVERRKAEKLYLEFIKSSMRFYRSYIQRLASHFRDIPEVLDVARKFSMDGLSADPPEPVDTLLKSQIVRSCYLSLVQLGDLSRYRETELQTKERNWGPAKGYYDLAIALDPTSGVAYNQLAVIALNDQDHLRAVYYLYRAIMVSNPAPQAPGNLELEFKKIRTRASQGKPISSGSVKGEGDLTEHFIKYHSRCADKGFISGDDQQSEIFQQLADDLREKPFDTKVRKFCLINIAAEDAVAQKVRCDDATLFRAFQNFQQFNVGTFFLLVKLMLDELQQLAKDPQHGADGRQDHIPVTPVLRRILSHLRLYSGWLLSTVKYLLASDSLKVQMRQFWLAYAEALSLLVRTYPIVDIPEITYLLDEDLDTLGFSPFSEFVREKRFQNTQGEVKPAHSEALFGTRSPEKEMLYRIKCLIKDGIFLCRKQDELGAVTIPLTFADNRFVFLDEDGRPSHTKPLTPPVHTHTNSVDSVSREDIEAANKFKTVNSGYPEDMSDAGVSASATSTMENMVNNLTQPEGQQRFAKTTNLYEESLNPTLKTPTAQSFAERGMTQVQVPAFTARDLVQQIQRSSSSSFPSFGDTGTNRPVLPSIMNSPFAPLPGETPGSSPRPSTAQHYHAPFAVSPQTRQFQASLAQQQHQVQMRTSPADSPQPTMSSHFDTPSNLTSWIRAADQLQPVTSWQSSPYYGTAPDTIISSRPPEPAPFGAIGEPRPKSSSSPTTAQPG